MQVTKEMPKFFYVKATTNFAIFFMLRTVFVCKTGVSMAAMPLPPVVNAMGGGVMMPQGLSMATISQGQIISGNTVYQMVHTPQGIVAQPIQVKICLSESVKDSTFLLTMDIFDKCLDNDNFYFIVFRYRHPLCRHLWAQLQWYMGIPHYLR